MEEAFEFFSVFGGLGVEVDTTEPLLDAIEEHILDEYDFIHSNIIEKTRGDSIAHSVLTGLAIGDAQAHTAFKRSKLSAEEGPDVIKHLIDLGIITREPSREMSNSWIQENTVSDKLHFVNPFMRFWFAFVSPIFKGIAEGNYEEFEERIHNRKQEFIDQSFVLLSQELIRENFKTDPIVEMGSYWDKEVEIDIYAKTASGKTIVGTCKYTNTKIKKNELTKLKEKALHVKIDADIFVLISKQGFSSEMKNLKGESLKLLTLRNFKSLLTSS
ncbi:MAG: DUF234 domain-containing protein [Campylobacterota bacterium]|nr:DUF234 domain-containing protein [Campylobacterota bacterium]